jgi:RsiW-degrading membrane proteinase PrsW (M82 family)
MTALAILLALVPAVGLLVYYYQQDRFRPEPKSAILVVFIAGGLSTAVAYVVEWGMDTAARAAVAPSRWPLLFAAVEAFLIAGPVEEGLKLLTVRVTAYRRQRFDQVADGIVYTIVASLGFALLEDLRYLYLFPDVTTMVVRGVTAVPMHAFMSGLMGYEIGLARFSPTRRQRVGHFARGLLLAAFLHGSYDFCIMTGIGGLMVLMFPLLAFGFLLLRARFQTALALDFQRLGPELAGRRSWGLPGLRTAAAQVLGSTAMVGGTAAFAMPPWWRQPELVPYEAPSAAPGPPPAATDPVPDPVPDPVLDTVAAQRDA